MILKTEGAQWRVYLEALARRFPYAKAKDLLYLQENPTEVTQVLANAHDLTINETREELEDLMFIAALARDAADFRLSDTEVQTGTPEISRVAS